MSFMLVSSEAESRSMADRVSLVLSSWLARSSDRGRTGVDALVVVADCAAVLSPAASMGEAMVDHGDTVFIGESERHE
jgi:hypothetical protein